MSETVVSESVVEVKVLQQYPASEQVPSESHESETKQLPKVHAPLTPKAPDVLQIELVTSSPISSTQVTTLQQLPSVQSEAVLQVSMVTVEVAQPAS